MIKTNLLPYRAARKKENIRKQLSIFVLFFIFLSMAFFFWHFTLSVRISKMEENLSAKEAELKEYQEQVKEVDSIKAQLDTLNKKLDVMAKLNLNRQEPVKLMESLSNLTIKGRMWIVDISDTGTGININGIAIDNKTVAVFMSRIEEDPFFSGVELKDLMLVERSGLQLKEFKLVCTKAV